MLDPNQIVIPGSLIIFLIGLLSNLFYLFIDKEKADKNLAFKYLRRLTIAVMILSFGFLTILIIFALIILITKITVVLLGY
jgi:hypothetical protein